VDGPFPSLVKIMSLRLVLAVVPIALVAACDLASPRACAATAAEGRPDIILILADDHRFDAAGFMGHPYLETPHLDRLSRGGVVFENAFVTTSLCSPSRASILTGLYAHRHGVIDNYAPVPPGLETFPVALRESGYRTAFVGKWHMGDTDAPQPGFDYWLSFRGQGSYWADGHGTQRVVPQTSNDGYNINGRRVPQRGYITDELTDYALAWLSRRDGGGGAGADSDASAPRFLYLSHKAIHSDFVPADRHRGRYDGKTIPLPATFADTGANYDDKPMWLKNQRNSRHGVDDAFNLGAFDIQAYHRRYCETLLAVDDSLGRILAHLEETGRLDSTLVIYMGDNGYQFGEHGLIDKRTAYEASMRIPLIAHWPARLPAGGRVKGMVANIDIAPSVLSAASVDPPAAIDGRDFLPLALGRSTVGREALLYEYFWEWNYPYTPTMHAIRTDRFKYIRYHGLWDLNELYDLAGDPGEARNLAVLPEHRETVRALEARLFELLRQTDGLRMPLQPGRDADFPGRRRDGSAQAPFPESFFRPARPR
jgi:N-acetylglucosamine-6-sulfatase